MEGLAIPMTIVHGDMNYSNMLTGCRHCQFIHWYEAYVSTPFITLQHLLLLNKIENPEIKAFTDHLLKDKYKKVWLFEQCYGVVVCFIRDTEPRTRDRYPV
jgi:hypothetical protein